MKPTTRLPFGDPDADRTASWAGICGIIDTWKTMPGKEQWQHRGLMTPTGEFYSEIEEAIQDLSSRRYEIATLD